MNKVLLITIPIIIILISYLGIKILSDKYYLVDKNVLVSNEIRSITNYCVDHKIYSKKIDYNTINKTIKYYSSLFEIDYYIVTAICIRESEFNRYAVNTNIENRTGKNIDIGLFQINMYYWGDVITELDRMKVHFKNKKSIELIKNVLFDIDHNVFMGCFILKNKIIENDGNIYRAIARYNGSVKSSFDYSEDVLKIANELRLNTLGK